MKFYQDNESFPLLHFVSEGVRISKLALKGSLRTSNMPKVKLSKKKPEKSLTVAMRKKGGRNKAGRITVRHRGGGSKRRYRLIDFGQERLGEKAKVIAIEYDPNRTCNIALVQYEDGKRKYILAPDGLGDGDEVLFDEKTPLKTGNRLRLENAPVGTMVYNIELDPERGGKLARGAGASCQIMAHEGKYTNLRLPSSEVRKVLSKCFASIGQLSNPEHRFEKLGKAGRARLKGKRPTVRGSAMAPVDHPHGGGEGRAGIGLKYPKTKWGKPALGVKTRNKKKKSSRLIIQRRQKKKRK